MALFLVALLFLALPSSENSRRHADLQAALDDLDRAVRFASNEAVLRNAVVRLRLDLEKEPVRYVVEYGPKGELVLPEMSEDAPHGSDEAEKEKKKLKDLDSQFTKVEEFEELEREFSPEVSFIGVATTWQKRLVKKGQAAAFFYPTGERDGALFFLHTQDEVGVLEVEPFQEKTRVHLFPFPPAAEGDVAKANEFPQTKMEEFHKAWLAP